MQSAILAIDQGTTRTKALVFDAQARVLAESSSEIPLTYPQSGRVEQDPHDLLRSVIDNARRVLASLEATDTTCLALGLSNQGETVTMWRSDTGEPLYNAISWQDRRTDAFCDALAKSKDGRMLQERTGLPLDPYFSATKLRWLLDNVPDARQLAEQGKLLAGTTDAWLLWSLTGEHRTDETTASRTMLYNPRLRDWDDEALAILNIPRSVLPAIQPSCSHFGVTREELFGYRLPITAALVDQQAALFGQVCYAPGDAKVTYGTGAFILMQTGSDIPTSHFGLVPTVAWSLSSSTGGMGDIRYALDGGIYVAGAAVQWLRDGLGIIQSAEETYAIALSVPDSGGAYFVPALAGLAAPYWDSYARGTIVGLTRGTTRAHLVRATLEGIAYRTRDVLEAMARDTGHALASIKVDGGASDNPFLMQSLADICGVEVRVAATRETTALGAAFMAGLGVGLWNSQDELAALWRQAARYVPRQVDDVEQRYRGWLRAVERAKGWAMRSKD
ncbi:MAG TPA: glycerol kinase GlpK [Ktedonobacteraceae bacterium]|nr:glycerol kinase GlpK [Ktedonobacteraceae bacterium]